MNTKLLGLLAAMAITGSATATDYTVTTIMGTGTSQTTALRTTTGVRTAEMVHVSRSEGGETDGGSTILDTYTLVEDSITSNNTVFDSRSASMNGLRATDGNSTTTSTIIGLTTINGVEQFDSWQTDYGHDGTDSETTIVTDSANTPYSYSTPFENEYTTITDYQRVD